MANMSYCRMRNTANDLQDCINAIEEGEYTDGISREERQGLDEILELAQYLVDNLQDEIEEMSITY